jgi:hypothetical protein
MSRTDRDSARGDSLLSTAAFYCVSSSDYFLGAVALLNSLRLQGHEEPFVVLDCGLDPTQKELLTPHAILVAAPTGSPPSLLKGVAPLSHPACVMALLDADIIVTRRLDDLLEEAGRRRIVAFANDRDRFFPEWGTLLGLAPPRRQAYLSSGALFLEFSLAERVLTLLRDLQIRIDFGHSWLEAGTEDYPFFFADQDILNAILASQVPPDLVVALPNRLAPNLPFRRLRVVDEGRLACAYPDGVEPYMLHHFDMKPWLVTVRSNIYSRLLTRVLLAPDVRLRLEPEQLPLRLRTGRLARAERARADFCAGIRGATRRRLGIQRQAAAWPHRSDAADRSAEPAHPLRPAGR